MKKVGLLFGSFNPITNSHIALGTKALAHVNEVWFVLSPASPVKHGKNILIDEYHRWAMLNLALMDEDETRLIACDIELKLDKPSWTHITIQKLKEKNPETSFNMICGFDVLNYLKKWKETDYVIESMDGFISQERNDISIDISETIKQKLTILPAQEGQVSSTLVRDNVRNKKPIHHLISPSVYYYIKEQNIYTNEQ